MTAEHFRVSCASEDRVSQQEKLSSSRQNANAISELTPVTPLAEPLQQPDTETVPQEWPRWYRLGSFLAAGTYIVLFVWMFATSSLWLDETLTAWVTAEDLSTCWERAWNFQGQSPVYFVLTWGIRQVLGSSELVLRSLSISSVFLTAYITYRLLIRLGCQTDAWIGGLVVALVMISDFEIGMAARPYALAICAATASFYSLIRWLDEQSWTLWGAYCVTTFAAIVLHYLFATIAAAHFAVFILSKNKSQQRIISWLCGWVLIGVGLLPLMPHLLVVKSKSEQYRISLPPTLDSSLHYMVQSDGLLILLLITAAFGIFLRPHFDLSRLNKKVAGLGLIWWMAGPVGIFLVYHLLGMTLNVPRYFSWRLPAISLLTISLLHLIPSRRMVVLPIMVIAGLLLPLTKDWDRTGWKEALAWGSDFTQTEPKYTPVAYTGLIESADREWIQQPEFQAYMRAPLAYYNGPQEAWILPICIPRSVDVFEESLNSLLNSHDHLIVYMRRKPSASRRLKQHAQQAGFEIEKTPQFGLTEVVVLKRKSPLKTAAL